MTTADIIVRLVTQPREVLADLPDQEWLSIMRLIAHSLKSDRPATLIEIIFDRAWQIAFRGVGNRAVPREMFRLMEELDLKIH